MNKKRVVFFLCAKVIFDFPLFLLFFSHFTFAVPSESSLKEKDSSIQQGLPVNQSGQPEIKSHPLLDLSPQNSSDSFLSENESLLWDLRKNFDDALVKINQNYSELSKIISLFQPEEIFPSYSGDKERKKKWDELHKPQKNQYSLEFKSLEKALREFSQLHEKTKKEVSKKNAEESEATIDLVDQYKKFVQPKIALLDEKIAAMNIHLEQVKTFALTKGCFSFEDEKKDFDKKKELIDAFYRAKSGYDHFERVKDLELLKLADYYLIDRSLDSHHAQATPPSSGEKSDSTFKEDSNSSLPSFPSKASLRENLKISRDNSSEDLTKHTQEKPVSSAALDFFSSGFSHPLSSVYADRNLHEDRNSPISAGEKKKNEGQHLEKRESLIKILAEQATKAIVSLHEKESSVPVAAPISDRAEKFFLEEVVENPHVLISMTNSVQEKELQKTKEISEITEKACKFHAQREESLVPLCVAARDASKSLDQALAAANVPSEGQTEHLEELPRPFAKKSLPQKFPQNAASPFSLKKKVFFAIRDVQSIAGEIFSQFKSLGNLFRSKSEEEKFDKSIKEFEEAKKALDKIREIEVSLNEKANRDLAKLISRDKEAIQKSDKQIRQSELEFENTLNSFDVKVKNFNAETNKEKKNALKAAIEEEEKKLRKINDFSHDLYNRKKELEKNLSLNAALKDDQEHRAEMIDRFLDQEKLTYLKKNKLKTVRFFDQKVADLNKKAVNLNKLIVDMQKAEDKASKKLESKKAALEKEKGFKFLINELDKDRQALNDLEENKYRKIKNITNFILSVNFDRKGTLESLQREIENLREDTPPEKELKRKIKENKDKISHKEDVFLGKEKSALSKIQAKKKEYRERFDLIKDKMGDSFLVNKWNFSGWFKSFFRGRFSGCR